MRAGKHPQCINLDNPRIPHPINRDIVGGGMGGGGAIIAELWNNKGLLGVIVDTIV